MGATTQEAVRYQLTLMSYPNLSVIPQVGTLIYQNPDKSLLGALASLPYTVGRSYNASEIQLFHAELKKLNVGHRFISNTPGLSAPSFDPSKPEQPVEAPVKNNKKFSLPLKPIGYGMGAIILLFLAYQGISRINFAGAPASQKSETSTTEIHYAEFTKIQRDVEFRTSRDFIWHKAKLDTGLNENDSVRTFAESSAIIKYKMGSILSVRPNTLVVIGRAGQEPDSPQTIKLEDGAIQARLRASDKSKKFIIQTRDGNLELTSPKPGAAAQEAKVETKQGKTSITVSVSSGEAVLKSNKDPQKIVKISELQSVTSSEGNFSDVVPFAPEITLFAPVDGSTIKFDPEKPHTISFTWDEVAEGSEYVFQLGLEPSMKDVVLSQTTLRPIIQLNYLDLGTLYWRVTSTNSNGSTVTSPVWRLNVQKTD